jgi:hypothetical protein
MAPYLYEACFRKNRNMHFKFQKIKTKISDVDKMRSTRSVQKNKLKFNVDLCCDVHFQNLERLSDFVIFYVA